MENVGQHGTVGASLSHPVMTLLVSVLPAFFVRTIRTSFSLILVTEPNVLTQSQETMQLSQWLMFPSTLWFAASSCVI